MQNNGSVLVAAGRRGEASEEIDEERSRRTPPASVAHTIPPPAGCTPDRCGDVLAPGELGFPLGARTPSGDSSLPAVMVFHLVVQGITKHHTLHALPVSFYLCGLGRICLRRSAPCLFPCGIGLRQRLRILLKGCPVSGRKLYAQRLLDPAALQTHFPT
jgi:hypothetical protein